MFSEASPVEAWFACRSWSWSDGRSPQSPLVRPTPLDSCLAQTFQLKFSGSCLRQLGPCLIVGDLFALPRGLPWPRGALHLACSSFLTSLTSEMSHLKIKLRI